MAAAVDPCSIPAIPAPEGMVSNLVNPVSFATTAIPILAILVAWATIFSVIRIYNNIRELKLGDYAIILAVGMSIGYFGVIVSERRTFRHNWDIPACFYNGTWVKDIFVCSFLYHLGCFFAKLSIFLLFLDVFKVQKGMRIAIWIGMIFNFVIYAIGLTIAIYYDVPHIGETWQGTLLDGQLLIPLTWVQLESGLIVLLDLYIFILPLPSLFKLNMPARRRISLVAVFSLALLGIVASIASLAERIPIRHKLDQTWIAAILSMCSGIELNVAIIVCCAPAFASALRKLPNFSDLPGLSAAKSLLSRSKLSTSGKSSYTKSTDSDSFFKSGKEGQSTVSADHQTEWGRMHNGSANNWQQTSGGGNPYETADVPKEGTILLTRSVEQERVNMSTDDANNRQQNYYSRVSEV